MKLRFFLLLLPSLIHAGGIEDPIFFSREKGRPKIIPRFETWGEKTEQGFSHDLQKQGNLTLYQLDGTPLKLSNLWAEKPVLLVHSSLTCPISRDNCPHVDRIQANFGDQIEVVVLYTTEAHPAGSPSPYSEGGKLEWLTNRNIFDDVLADEPKTLEARITRAKEYRDQQKIKSRLIVDGMSNDVWKFFGAGPNTGTLIATGGEVIHRQGWLEPSLMAGSIRAHFAEKLRDEIQPKLKGTALEHGHWKLTAPQLEEIASRVPEVVQYHLSNRGSLEDQTLLHLSVSDLKLDLTKKLLALGASPNSQDEDGLTPLHYALRLEKPMVEKEPYLALLLDHDASGHTRSDRLESAMHFAVQSRSLETVQFVTKRGFSNDTYSIDGISPLHEALFQGDSEIAAYLLSQGAAKDLYAAAALGDIESVERFLAVSPNSWSLFQGRSGRSPLIYASIGGHLDMIKLLLSRQTENLKFPNRQLIASLKKCNVHGHIEAGLAIAEQALPLVGKNAPPPTQSLVPLAPPPKRCEMRHDQPVFHEIAQANHPKLLKALIRRGWDLEALDLDERTALHVAARLGHLEIMDTLIKAGANLEAKAGKIQPDPCGPAFNQRSNFTPLHFAVIKRKPSAVQLLVNHEAKVDTLDAFEHAPLRYTLPHYPGTKLSKKYLEQSRLMIKSLHEAKASFDKPAIQGQSFREFLEEWFEPLEIVDGKSAKGAKVQMSPELLKFVNQLCKE